MTADHLMQGTTVDGGAFPFAAITYINSSNEIDIASISVDSRGKTWGYDGAFQLPEQATPSDISEMTVANVFGYQGLFCLYNVGGFQHLTFIAPDVKLHRQIQIVHDVTALKANCITSFLDPTNLAAPNKYTAVAFSAPGGLYYFPSVAAGRRNSTPIQLSGDPAFANTREIYIAQSGSCTSIWATNGLNQIVYQQFDSSMTALTPPVVLLEAASGGKFAALLHGDTASQHLYVLGSTGIMTQLEQSGTTRLWQSSPYVLPSTGINFPFTSFTAQVKIAGADGLPVGVDKSITHQVQLSCDSVMTVTVNGVVCTVTPTGVAVDIDQSGSITILIPTDTCSSPLFHVTDVPGASETSFNGTTLTIDPSVQVKITLGNIHNVTDLAASLPPGVSPNPAALAAAQPLLKQLTTRAKQCDAGGTQKSLNSAKMAPMSMAPIFASSFS